MAIKNKNMENNIIPMTRREINSPYMKTNPKGTGIKKIPKKENVDKVDFVENKITILATKNIFKKYGTEDQKNSIDKKCKNNSSDILTIRTDSIIVMTKRESDSPYLCSNYKEKYKKNTPEMEHLKKEPKPRTRNLVLVKWEMSKRPKKRDKPIQRVLLPSEIQKAL